MIKRITKTLAVGDVANAFTFSTGDDGKALSGKRGLLVLVVPPGANTPVGTSASVFLRVNDISTGYRNPANSSDTDAAISIGSVRNLWARIITDMFASNGTLTTRSNGGYSDGTTRSYNGLYIGGHASIGSAITKIYFFLSGSYTLPAGTIIEYWEVPA